MNIFVKWYQDSATGLLKVLLRLATLLLFFKAKVKKLFFVVNSESLASSIRNKVQVYFLG